MSLQAGLDLLLGLGFPRVSGDEPGDQVAVSGTLAFSPRERG